MINKEMYEDFLSDYGYNLKREFAGLMKREMSDSYIFEGEDFENYCKEQFREWLQEIQYKYN